MRRWLIQQNYAFKSALRRLYTQPFSSLANLFVISVILVVPLLSASVLMSLKPITNKLSIQTEITLFAKQDISNQQLNNLAQDIQDQYQEVVANVNMVNKEMALESLKGLAAWDTAINALDSNPLPDVLIVTLKENINQTKIANDLYEQWSNLEYIDNVQLDQDWIKQLSNIINFLQVALFTLSIGFAVVIISTVFNTVRMQAMSLHDEIAVMRTVGATESFVRRPFLYLGALIGLISSLIAIATTKIIIIISANFIDGFGQLYGTSLKVQLPSLNIILLALLMVVLLSAIAARWSIKKA